MIAERGNLTTFMLSNCVFSLQLSPLTRPWSDVLVNSIGRSRLSWARACRRLTAVSCGSRSNMSVVNAVAINRRHRHSRRRVIGSPKDKD